MEGWTIVWGWGVGSLGEDTVRKNCIMYARFIDSYILSFLRESDLPSMIGGRWEGHIGVLEKKTWQFAGK